jgi:hypothetical protein
MLNYNKIHSLINNYNTAKSKLASFIGIGESTFRDRLSKENLTPNDVEKIADYYKKPIVYFFDRDDNDLVNEPGVTTYSCPDCIKKQKEIDRLNSDIREVQKKYIECLEQLAASKGGDHIANSA